MAWPPLPQSHSVGGSLVGNVPACRGQASLPEKSHPPPVASSDAEGPFGPEACRVEVCQGAGGCAFGAIYSSFPYLVLFCFFFFFLLF